MGGAEGKSQSQFETATHPMADALYYHINSKGAFVRSIFAGASAV